MEQQETADRVSMADFTCVNKKKKNICRNKDSDQTVFMVKNTDALCLKEIKNDNTLIQTHSSPAPEENSSSF